MDLSAVSPNTNTTATDLFRQRRVAMQAVDTGVPSDDFATTQANIATLQTDRQNLPPSTGQQSLWQNTLKTDLSNLPSAVQEDNAAIPQSGWQPVLQQASAAPPNSIAPAASSTDASSNLFLNNLTALLNSVVSGVQTAAATLQQDFQSVFGSTAPSSAPAAPNPSQNAFLDDLQAIIAGLGPSDAQGIQTGSIPQGAAQSTAASPTTVAFDAKSFFDQLDRTGHA
jgi:hypothetical protein